MEQVKNQLEAEVIEQVFEAEIPCEIILPPTELDGTATPEEVFAGKTFYTKDCVTKETGTYVPTVLDGDA